MLVDDIKEFGGYKGGADFDGDYMPEICSCANPNGFKFIERGDDYQIWLHTKCGGQVIRPLIKA